MHKSANGGPLQKDPSILQIRGSAHNGAQQDNNSEIPPVAFDASSSRQIWRRFGVGTGRLILGPRNRQIGAYLASTLTIALIPVYTIGTRLTGC